MKVTRRQLKNIIREFLDVGAKKTATRPSVYDQASNSERAAFISAMGIAEKASKSKKIDALNEGPVLPFRQKPGVGVTPGEEMSGEVVDFPYDEDVEDFDGDITPEDLDTFGLDKTSPLDVFKKQIANASKASKVPPMTPEEEEELDDDFGEYLDAVESGKVVEFPDEYEEDEY